MLCRRFGLTDISLQGQSVRFSPAVLPESALVRLARLYPKSLYKPTVSTMAVPRPKGVVKPDGSFAPVAFGGEPLRDIALLTWCAQVFEQILAPISPATPGSSGAAVAGSATSAPNAVVTRRA